MSYDEEKTEDEQLRIYEMIFGEGQGSIISLRCNLVKLPNLPTPLPKTIGRHVTLYTLNRSDKGDATRDDHDCRSVSTRSGRSSSPGGQGNDAMLSPS